jgi:cyclic 2,3-diphosphoglycerate synthetase
VGWSANLADRKRLEEDMDKAERYDVLLTELKAAAVDVAAERASARGAEIVVVDNRPTDPALTGLVRETLDLARSRHKDR